MKSQSGKLTQPIRDLAGFAPLRRVPRSEAFRLRAFTIVPLVRAKHRSRRGGA